MPILDTSFRTVILVNAPELRIRRGIKFILSNDLAQIRLGQPFLGPTRASKAKGGPMATEWFYEKDGEKLGPVTTQGLKELAASGQLDPQDLVWRMELEAWQPADRVRGLFPGGTMPPPLPIPTSERPSELGPAREPGDPKQQSTAKLGDSILDAAKGMAAKARGFAGSDEVKDAVGRTKKAVAGVGDRAKEAARKAREYAGSDEVKDAVGKSKKAAAAIGGRALRAIRDVNKTTNATGSDATETDQPSGSRIRDNALVIALSMMCCFPLGLVFVWTSPRWSTGQKGAWTALLIPLFMLGSCAQKASIQESEETAELLADGDRLWDAGNRDRAAEKYREAWREHKLTLSGNTMTERSKELVGPHLPNFYARLMQYESSKGNSDLANQVFQQASKDGIAVSPQPSGISRDQPAKNQADSPSLSKVGEFNENEIATIHSDANLRVVYEMGHLDHEKYTNFLRMNRNAERNNSTVAVDVFFLGLVPSKDWFDAARKRSMSKRQFQIATNLLFMGKGLSKEGLANSREYNAVLYKLTGQTLDEYTPRG